MSTLNKYLNLKNDNIIGGKADNLSILNILEKHRKKYPDLEINHILNQFEIGILVEKEHTNDEEKAAEIAKDHLYENKDYYIKLISDGLADEEDAIKLFRKYFPDIKINKKKKTTNESLAANTFDKVVDMYVKTYKDFHDLPALKKVNAIILAYTMSAFNDFMSAKIDGELVKDNPQEFWDVGNYAKYFLDGFKQLGFNLSNKQNSITGGGGLNIIDRHKVPLFIATCMKILKKYKFEDLRGNMTNKIKLAKDIADAIAKVGLIEPGINK